VNKLTLKFLSHQTEMSLRVGKYDWRTRIQPTTPGYTNILIHTTGQLTPFTLKTPQGYIMENVFQSCKVLPSVPAQNDIKHQWSHPAEVHVDAQGNPTPEYWRWRQKVLSHRYPLRYPGGYHNRHNCLYSLVPASHPGPDTITGPDGNPYMKLNYIQSRIHVYYPLYVNLARQQPDFHALKARLDAGENLQINEVDGPRYTNSPPFHLVENGSIPVTEEVVKQWLHNPIMPFGHASCLATALLGHDDWII